MRIPCVKTARMVILVLRSPLDHHSITVAYLQAAATDRFGGDQRRVLGTVRGTPRGFGRLSTKQWGFNQERWVMNCCAKERWVLKFHEEWEDCKYDLQVSFIAITYYILYIYTCVCMASDKHLTIMILLSMMQHRSREAWIWLRRLIEFSPRFQQGTWEYRGVPTSKTLFDKWW